MSVVTVPVKYFEEHYECDFCGQGQVLPVGTVLLSMPPIYPHRCNKCGQPYNFPHRYPTLVLERENDDA